MDKVFVSEITRNPKEHDDLYDLLKVDIAEPLPVTSCTAKHNDYDFIHKSDKYYIPKKKSKLKVFTVRNIRSQYEKEVLTDLRKDLEKQQNLLMRMIRSGSSRNDQTKIAAKKILNNDSPISRMSWQMLMNINPEEKIHSSQYVFWNRNCIRVNGSKGGKNKFLCYRDLSGVIKEPLNNSALTKKTYMRKKGLLRNTLAINFKPGPLTKKSQLDKSYQKYNLGTVELVKLPKPGLEIQPTYGTALDTTVSNFLCNFRESDGFITQKWAEFAVSVLGSANGSKLKQTSKRNITTFDLNYKCNQNRILMRRDESSVESITEFSSSNRAITNDSDILPEVLSMLDKMLDTIEISVNEGNYFTGEDEIRSACENIVNNSTNSVKDKIKKKYGELDRLDVTVIRLGENETVREDLTCKKSYCTFGCICNTLQCNPIFKKHCGRIDCMFECKCDFSKYKVADALGSDCAEILPGLINLDIQLNSSLSKEEQKFHQTVIVSGDKSILLKAKKRNSKTTKKYAEFYSNMSLKSETEIKPVLSIVTMKLNCKNIEPWCMVHNLYRCFCKGKFTESSNETVLNETKEMEKAVVAVGKELPANENIPKVNSEENKRYQTRKLSVIEKEPDIANGDSFFEDSESHICARARPFNGRKFNSEHYSEINKKILDLECEDTLLRTKLSRHLHPNETTYLGVSQSNNSISNCIPNEDQNIDIEKVKAMSIVKQQENIIDENDEGTSNELSFDNKLSDVTFEKTDLRMIDTSTDSCISNKPKLVAWLESSYKHYKKLMEMGVVRTTLEAPKKGKVSLYPWDFILNRYKERKNLFLISKQPPYRIFICVDKTHRIFDNCISIDDIRFADLNKYPITVKHLLTNTSGMDDHFCILFGSSVFWELVGSVLKMNDSEESREDGTSSCSELSLEYDCLKEPLKVDKNQLKENTILKPPEKIKEQSESTSESSKWFVMTVENDFSEIQFYNKGFFVKYESIVRALKVARVSGKTVRLSSQKCADKINAPQFGIYAIPTTKEDCVFVGPYEPDENLGIETVKTVTGGRKLKRTRGVWINTNKIDNLKVIDNPLSFMPESNLENWETLPIQSDSPAFNIDKNSTLFQSPTKIKNVTPKKDTKRVKPIKIRKTDGFFKVTPQAVGAVGRQSLPFSKWTPSTVNAPSHLLPTSDSAPPLVLQESLDDLPIIIATDSHLINDNNVLASSSLESLPIIIAEPEMLTNAMPPLFERKLKSKIPVAEVAPQIKISAVYSEAPLSPDSETKRPERGMFILKPEEINQRLFENKVSTTADASSSAESIASEINNYMDVEDFLDSSIACDQDESLIISDEDESPIKEIWLKCKNIENLGTIRAKIDKENRISFEFPGFKYTSFYSKDEAFVKINQVLSRKIWIPKNLKIEWYVIDSENEAEAFKLLKENDLTPDMVLTKQGLVPKSAINASKKPKTYMRKRKASSNLQSSNTTETVSETSKVPDETNEFGQDEINTFLPGNHLLKEAIVKSLNEATDKDREELSNTLEDILTQALG